jgi:16S rRNA (guanine527-N7)-methyltransferase
VAATGQDFDFVAGLRTGCKSMGLPEFSEKAEGNLLVYFSELKKWSRKINLIAKKASDQDILEKHFLDSLSLVPFLQKKGTHLLDIGTGAGFPGLVCKTVLPELQVTLVEPRLKRVSFLRHVARTLGCSGLSILDCRADDEVMLSSESGFTHISSRAVSDITLFLGMSARFLQPGVQVVCMKGPKWNEELKAYQKSDESSDIKLCGHEQYSLPHSSGSRHLLFFEKQGNNR